VLIQEAVTHLDGTLATDVILKPDSIGSGGVFNDRKGLGLFHGGMNAATLLIILCSMIYGSCGQTTMTYVDAQIGQRTFGDLIATAPIIVVARVAEREKVGHPGLIARHPDQPAFPAQRYGCELLVLRPLRGDLIPSTRVTAYGYEMRQKVQIGPPMGVCGQPGTIGVYFLRGESSSLRVMVDAFRSRIDLDNFEDSDLNVIQDVDDPGRAIWRLLVTPLETGRKPTTQDSLSVISESTREALGRIQFIDLLRRTMRQSAVPEFSLEACIYLNRVDWGLGLEECAAQLSKQSWIDAERRSTLANILDTAHESNEKLRSWLRTMDQQQLMFVAQSRDPIRVKEFVCFLAQHPDPDTRSLSRKLLAIDFLQRMNDIPCPTYLAR